MISPFEADRNEVDRAERIRRMCLSAAFVYELPFGQGKKY